MGFTSPTIGTEGESPLADDRHRLAERRRPAMAARVVFSEIFTTRSSLRQPPQIMLARSRRARAKEMMIPRQPQMLGAARKAKAEEVLFEGRAVKEKVHCRDQEGVARSLALHRAAPKPILE